MRKLFRKIIAFFFSSSKEEKGADEIFKQAILDYTDKGLKDDKDVIHFVEGTLFDAKYTYFVNNPKERLNSLYKRAYNRDNTLLRDQFFRQLRKDKDRNALKLTLILKKNR